MKLFHIGVVASLLVLSLAACLASRVEPATGIPQSQGPEAVTGGITATSTRTVAAAEPAQSVAFALAENDDVHDAGAAETDPAVTTITLSGGSIAVAGDGVAVDGSTAVVTAAGGYTLRGSLTDGQIVVNTTDEEAVRLILDGVDIRNSKGPAIHIVNAEETVIVLADGAENRVADGAPAGAADPGADEPNAAIFSMGDLTFSGNGSLAVSGTYGDGITSKDGLVIASGAITVDAVDDGVRGKDYLVIKGGTLTVSAGGDGLKSDNEEDAERGFVWIESGTIDITSGGDAIQARTDVLIKDGVFTLASGGGSGSRVDADSSAKAIKAGVNVTIDGGAFSIDAADDALHSNADMTVNGGVFDIATGDDGLHADASVTLNGGEIRIARSYEGVESAVITINAGTLHVVSSDDGLNVAGGVDGSGMNAGPGRGARPGQGQSQDAFAYTGEYWLRLNGGTVAVDALGDGIDVNGAVHMAGGVLLVNGPTAQMNGALDYDAGFNMTGGFLVAAGSAGMAQAPGAASSQNSVLIYFTATQPAGTLIRIEDSAGHDVLTFAPTREYQSIAFSSPQLAQGATYRIYTGGSADGAAKDGLYQGAAYAGGTVYADFTVAGKVTQVGTGGWSRRRP